MRPPHGAFGLLSPLLSKTEGGVERKPHTTHMKRVTKEHLQAVVDRINRMTGSPLAQYVRAEDGRLIGQPGNYHLDGAYGGWALHRMTNDGGGVEDVLQVGHVPARELAGLMYAYIRGLEARNAEAGGAR